MELFCRATGMEMNRKIFYIHYSFPQEDLTPLLEGSLPLPRKHINEVLQYLGFILNPNAYGFDDWLWL